MVGIDEIYQRLSEIKQSIDYLQKISPKFLEDHDNFLLSRYYLQIILEAMFTIGNQLIANKKFRKPANYRDIITVLLEEKVITRKLYTKLLPYVEMRNRLVHTYWKISKEELLRISNENLNSFEDFNKRILKIINRFGKYD